MLTIDEIRACVAPLFVAKGAKRAVLFGSVARGTDAGRSDIDLLVVDDDAPPYFARLDKYYDELVELLYRPVGLFVYAMVVPSIKRPARWTGGFSNVIRSAIPSRENWRPSCGPSGTTIWGTTIWPAPPLGSHDGMRTRLSWWTQGRPTRRRRARDRPLAHTASTR
jgi:predicted nucleotidyltransferase